MSRIRTLVLRAIATSAAAAVGAGCGGPSDDGEVVARGSADAPAPADASSTDVAAEGTTGAPTDATVDASLTSAGAGPSSADPGIVVDVAGAVRRPGVYRMSPGARVHEAIEAAGGARRGAALGALNRAAVLVDGQQVLVGTTAPSAGGAATPTAGTRAVAAGAKVNLNSADAVALDALPGIGQVTAGHIIASREEAGPFASLDDLDRVPGIGPTTIESLRSVATT